MNDIPIGVHGKDITRLLNFITENSLCKLISQSCLVKVSEKFTLETFYTNTVNLEDK